METNTAASSFKAIFFLFLALVVLLAGSLLAGAILGVTGSYFYLVLVYPLFMGAAGGTIASGTIRLAGIRKRGLVVLVSVLAAGLMYGAFQYVRYLAVQAENYMLLSARARETGEEISLADARAAMNEALERRTGHSGFPGFMLYKAQNGISIGRFYRQSRLELTSWLAWLYWLLEFVAIAWITYSLAKFQLRAPVCESCGKRLGRERHLGGTAPANERLLLELIRRGDLAGLGRLLEKETGLPSVELYLRRCEACGQGASTLTVRRASLGMKGSVQLRDVSKSTLEPGESTRFLSQLRFEGE